MRIGVICEGKTDIPAIRHFIGTSLAGRGISATFEQIFPDPDQTRADAGWANVITWLERNPPESRIKRYFGQGLFSGGLSEEPFDAILIQIDADVIGHESFRNFISKKYGIKDIPQDSPDCINVVRTAIEAASLFSQMCNADQNRHVIAISTQSTETWCAAAFYGQPRQYENLVGNDLVNCFMCALEESEGRESRPPYANVDKNLERRERFCAKHASGYPRIEASCPNYLRAVNDVYNIS